MVNLQIVSFSTLKKSIAASELDPGQKFTLKLQKNL